MARAFVLLHDIPVVTTRRNSLPALGLPALSRHWNKATRAVWQPANETNIHTLFTPPTIDFVQHLSKSPLVHGSAINLVGTDIFWLAQEKALLHLITRLPYQVINIHILTTSEQKTSLLGRNRSIARYIRSVTPLKRQKMLETALVNGRGLVVNNYNEKVVSQAQTMQRPIFISSLKPLDAGDIILDATQLSKQSSSGQFQFVPKQFAGITNEAITLPFLERIRLFGEEVLNESSSVPHVLVTGSPTTDSFDQALSDKLSLLEQNNHEVVVAVFPHRKSAQWWPLFVINNKSLPAAPHLSFSTLTSDQAVDYLRQCLYEKKVSRAHSSAG